MSPAAALMLMSSLLVTSAALANDQALRSASEFASIKNKKARSVALFQEAGKVIQHPRCVNCHPAGDRPLQTDASASVRVATR